MELKMFCNLLHILLQSPFNMRQINLSTMKPPVSKNEAAAGTSKASIPYKPNALTSLDLLRQNIQRNINQDIQEVITKYMNVRVFFTRCREMSILL